VTVGQKTHPYGFRLVYNKTWHSRWYSQGKNYSDLLHQDLKLREDLKKRLGHAGVAAIDIERAAERLRVTIHTSRPGIIIGRKGAEVDRLRDDLIKRTGREVHINIQEIQRPELDSQLVAESIAGQLERRVSFRRAMKKAMESAFRFGAKGVKIMVAGRLGGAEIARTEWYQEGRLPLHTLKADIDFGFAESRTTYGVIGVKVWVYKGDLLKEKARRVSA
jgi:small subunit ribosomal protein S3